MITDIRDRLVNSKYYKTVILIVVVVLVISLAIPGIRIGMGEPWIAKVNGTQIGYNHFGRAMMQQEMILQQYGQQADPMMLQVFALEKLVQNELLAQAAATVPLHLHEDFICQKLADPYFIQNSTLLYDVVPPFVLDQNGINRAALNIYLKRMKLGMADFECAVHDALVRYLFQELLAQALYIPQIELQEYLLANYRAKKFAVVTFPRDLFVKKAQATPVGKTELQEFYTKQQAASAYFVPEKRSGVVWKFEPKKYGIESADADVEAYYNDHKNEFLDKPAQIQVRTLVLQVGNEDQAQETYKKAHAIREQLQQNPELFVDKVRELSDDAESRKKDGLLPLFAKGSHEMAFDRAAFLLQNDGDISDVIRTNKGYEILQRVTKAAPVYKQFSAVRNEIKERLVQQKFEDQFSQDLQRLADADAAAWQEFVKAHHGSEKSYDAVEKDGTKVAQELFGLTEGRRGFYADDQASYAIELTKVERGYNPSLETIVDQVKEDLHREQAESLLRETIGKARKQLATKSIQEIATEFGMPLAQTGMLKKGDSSAGKVALPVTDMLQLEKQGSVGLFMHEGNGYLVQVEQVANVSPTELEQHTKEARQALQQERMKGLIEGFVASLYRNATIKVNESLLKIG